MMQCKAKSENLAHILGYQIWAVTVLPWRTGDAPVGGGRGSHGGHAMHPWWMGGAPPPAFHGRVFSDDGDGAAMTGQAGLRARCFMRDGDDAAMGVEFFWIGGWGCVLFLLLMQILLRAVCASESNSSSCLHFSFFLCPMQILIRFVANNFSLCCKFT